MRPFTMTITYCSPVLLREIGIHGRDRTFPLSNQYVTNFSMSFSEDGDNFIEYIRDTGSTVCCVSNTHVFTDYVCVLLIFCRSLLCQITQNITLGYGLPSLPLV